MKAEVLRQTGRAVGADTPHSPVGREIRAEPERVVFAHLPTIQLLLKLIWEQEEPISRLGKETLLRIDYLLELLSLHGVEVFLRGSNLEQVNLDQIGTQRDEAYYLHQLFAHNALAERIINSSGVSVAWPILPDPNYYLYKTEAGKMLDLVVFKGKRFLHELALSLKEVLPNLITPGAIAIESLTPAGAQSSIYIFNGLPTKDLPTIVQLAGAYRNTPQYREAVRALQPRLRVSVELVEVGPVAIKSFISR